MPTLSLTPRGCWYSTYSAGRTTLFRIASLLLFQISLYTTPDDGSLVLGLLTPAFLSSWIIQYHQHYAGLLEEWPLWPWLRTSHQKGLVWLITQCLASVPISLPFWLTWTPSVGFTRSKVWILLKYSRLELNEGQSESWVLGVLEEPFSFRYSHCFWRYRALSFSGGSESFPSSAFWDYLLWFLRIKWPSIPRVKIWRTSVPEVWQSQPCRRAS